MNTAENSAQEWICVRIAAEHKRLIERAASITGQSLSDFVKSELLLRAWTLIQEEAAIRLTAKGWEQLADFIESEDDAPNQALRRAMERNPDIQAAARASRGLP